MYEYKTIVQDVVTDLDVQQKLDDVINEYAKQGWEVFSVTTIVHPYLANNVGEDIIIQKVYTLRRRVLAEEEQCLIFAPAKHADSIQAFIDKLR